MSYWAKEKKSFKGGLPIPKEGNEKPVSWLWRKRDAAKATVLSDKIYD